MKITQPTKAQISFTTDELEIINSARMIVDELITQMKDNSFDTVLTEGGCYYSIRDFEDLFDILADFESFEELE